MRSLKRGYTDQYFNYYFALHGKSASYGQRTPLLRQIPLAIDGSAKDLVMICKLRRSILI
jgi:hypothetical protein